MAGISIQEDEYPEKLNPTMLKPGTTKVTR
jgi:hypothetical protein